MSRAHRPGGRDPARSGGRHSRHGHDGARSGARAGSQASGRDAGRSVARPEAPEPPPLDGAPASRALLVLAIALGVLVLARAALTFAPGMALWSLNLQRFLAPPVAWAIWALAALALVPPLARRLEPWCARAGDAALDRPAPTVAIWAALAALLMWLLPDQVQFVGDSLLRQQTLQTLGAQPALWYPQAMPLDLLFHDVLGRIVIALTGMSVGTEGRLLGAFEAAALAALAVAFARELRLRGAAGFAATAVVLFGGYLTLFTGYNKCFTEMCLVVAATGVIMVRLARGRGGLLPLGLVLAAGALLHRSALALYPAALLAAWSWLRSQPRGTWHRPSVLAAVLIPLAAQTLALPRMLAVMGDIDARHFAPPEMAGRGLLAATFEPLRMLDLFNLTILLSPTFIAAVVMVAIQSRGWRRRAEARSLGLMSATLFALMLLVHPQQGLYRDWDVFAGVGVAFSLTAALVVGESLRSAPARAWLAVPVAIVTAGFTIGWLVHQADLDRGLERVHALLAGPPERHARYATTTWEYLGIRNSRARRWEDAAVAYREAAKRLPSPNILRQLGVAEERAGHLDRSRDVYLLMLSRNPSDSLAAQLLRGVSARLDTLSNGGAPAAPTTPR